MNKFDYQSDYKKFKNGDNVKISFKDGKNTITKNVKIISIGSKKISFKDMETVYECTSSEIKDITKQKNYILHRICNMFICMFALLSFLITLFCLLFPVLGLGWIGLFAPIHYIVSFFQSLFDIEMWKTNLMVFCFILICIFTSQQFVHLIQPKFSNRRFFTFLFICYLLMIPIRSVVSFSQSLFDIEMWKINLTVFCFVLICTFTSQRFVRLIQPKFSNRKIFTLFFVYYLLMIPYIAHILVTIMLFS